MNAKYLNTSTTDLIARREQILAKDQPSAEEQKELIEILKEIDERAAANRQASFEDPGFLVSTWDCVTYVPKVAAKGVKGVKAVVARIEPVIEPAAEAIGMAVETVVLGASVGIASIQSNLLGVDNIKDLRAMTYKDKEELAFQRMLEGNK